jgi:hypothetical protein
MLIPVLTLRLAWGTWPSIWLCAAFWAGAIVVATLWAHVLAQNAFRVHGIILMATGATLNGVVMIANGGYMPVIGKPAGFEYAIWASAESHTNLLFLADRMALGGVSPGDILIAVGVFTNILTGIAHWRARRQLRAAPAPVLIR